jgi:hypothetical protein
MEGLNFTVVGPVLIVLKAAGSNPSVQAWEALHDFIIEHAHDSRGVLIVSDGDPPSLAGRSLMRATFTRADKLSIALDFGRARSLSPRRPDGFAAHGGASFARNQRRRGCAEVA